MSLSTQSIYLGSWTNYTDGPVLGSTLTLTSRGGAFLVAFLAIYVRIAGGHFWDLFCRVAFHLNATDKPKDGLHHQHQAILRNKASEALALWQFLRTGWAWRGNATKRPLARSCGFALAAFLNFALFTAAGIFSSRVTSARSEVLLRSSMCGILDWQSNAGPTDTSTKRAETQAQDHNDLLESASYVQVCNESASASSTCQPYGRQAAKPIIQTNASCPFADGLCVSEPVLLDSGYMDSHLHFGINAPEGDRVSYRRVLQCAVLETEGYQSNLTNASASGLEASLAIDPRLETIIQYRYGPSFYLVEAGRGYDGNATMLYSNVSSPGVYGNNFANYLNIDTENALAGESTNNGTFIPIPELRRADADVYLVFLRNGLASTAPVNDPWFYAHYPMDEGGVTYYVVDPASPLGVLGCTQQAQFCNARSGVCSTLNGLYVDFNVSSLGLNARQLATLERLNSTISFGSSMAAVTLQLGPSYMLASMWNSLGYALPFPDTQWIQELEHWFQIILTSIELEVQRFVGGPSNAAAARYVLPPSAEGQWMCTSQIVQSQDFASFSVLGMVLILVIGGLIMATNLFLELIRETLPRITKGTPKLKHLEWTLTGYLQLQRMAFEGQGHGTWTKLTSLVPVTERGEVFGLLSATLPEDLPEMSLSPSGTLGSMFKTVSPTSVRKFWSSRRDVDEPTGPQSLKEVSSPSSTEGQNDLPSPSDSEGRDQSQVALKDNPEGALRSRTGSNAQT